MDNNALKYCIADSVRMARIRQRITQKRLSEMVGIPPYTICKIESGRSIPDAIQLLNLLNVLGIDSKDLYRRNES